MRLKAILLIIAIMLIVPFTACSNGSDAGNPAVPTDPSNIEGQAAPDLSLTNAPSDDFEIPADPDVAIELSPGGEAVEGNFTFGDTAVAGIEVRIDGELADFTDKDGNFEVPSILAGPHEISFGILGHEFHSQPYSPVQRFAQDIADPGPGVMAGLVYDEDGPVPGALVIVVQGDNYAYAFTGQYGQYYLAGAPGGNCLAAVLAEFHDPTFAAVNLPEDGTPLEKDFYIPKNMSYGRIYGRVVSPNVGVVPYAYVQYTAPGVFRADLSNIFGIFEMEAIPVGTGQIHAEHDYFYPVSFPYEINPGLNILPVIMHMIEQSTLHGIVTDENGEPMNGVVVKLSIYQEPYQYPIIYAKLSGPGGYFHFGDLLPGGFTLYGFLPGFIPGATAGFILPGTLLEENLTMVPGGGGYAVGFVEDCFGDPVEGAIVQLRYLGTEIGIATPSDEYGYYSFYDIPFGMCELRVDSAEYLPTAREWDVLPNENVAAMMIVFPVPEYVPVGELSGSVMDAVTGDAIPYSLVWIYNLADPNIMSFMTLADENGDYYFPNIIAGTNGGWALASGYIADDGYVEVLEGEMNFLDFGLTPE